MARSMSVAPLSATDLEDATKQPLYAATAIKSNRIHRAERLQSMIASQNDDPFAQSWALRSQSCGLENTGDRYATEEQKRISKYLENWHWFRLFYIPFVLAIYFFDFTFIPIRMAVGSDSVPSNLWIAECVVDAVLIFLMGLNFIQPVEVDGRPEHRHEAVAKRYLKGDFVVDAVAAFPLQIIILPLVEAAVAPAWLGDFTRINRLVFLVRFSSAFDQFSETYLTGIHPTAMRIVKFVFIIYYYTSLTVVPVYLILRSDPVSTKKWLGLNNDTITSYLEVVLLALSLASGRNFEYPITEQQISIMLVLSFLSLGSTSVIIAGVTSMVLSLVERSSKLSNKIDSVLYELSYMRVQGPLQDEILSYYHHMFSVFNTFDYTTSDDFFDDLPPDLQEAIHEEVSVATIKMLPLFADIVDDVAFVRAMADHLELFVLIPGTEIVRKGEEGDDMFFISKGEASVLSGNGNEIAVLQEGSFFGEQALLFGGVRTATIVAKTLCQVYALSGVDFERMIDLRPDALEKILEVTLARRNENARNPEMMAAMQKKRVERRQVIMATSPSDSSMASGMCAASNTFVLTPSESVNMPLRQATVPNLVDSDGTDD